MKHVIISYSHLTSRSPIMCNFSHRDDSQKKKKTSPLSPQPSLRPPKLPTMPIFFSLPKDSDPHTKPPSIVPEAFSPSNPKPPPPLASSPPPVGTCNRSLHTYLVSGVSAQSHYPASSTCRYLNFSAKPTDRRHARAGDLPSEASPVFCQVPSHSYVVVRCMRCGGFGEKILRAARACGDDE